MKNGFAERSIGRGQRLGGFLVASCACFLLLPFVGVSFFPRTDAGQFVINLKAPTGTRIELTNDYVKQVEDIVRNVVPPSRTADRSSPISASCRTSLRLFTPNSGMHTAFVEVGLKQDHKVSSFAYMAAVRDRMARELPELRTYFQSGGLVDAVLNQGVPAPYRCSSQRHRFANRQWHCAKSRPPIPHPARCFRRLHPAGHGLSGTGNQREPHARRGVGTQSQGGHRQHHYLSHIRRHDRARVTGSILVPATTISSPCSIPKTRSPVSMP